MAIDKIGGINNVQPVDKGVDLATKVGKDNGDSFAKALQGKLTDKVKEEGLSTDKPISLTFSSHAVERMRQRGITFSPEKLAKIDEFIQKAEDKGAKETLVLDDDNALIVNVKSKKVVTVMDKSLLKDNIFTKIDSTVVI